MALSVHSTLKKHVPISKKKSVMLVRIHQHILGAPYDVSLVFAGDTRLRSLNRIYRNKDTTTNVLAFPLSDTNGEIFINAPLARRYSKRVGVALQTHVFSLFIHACLHLKGYHHSDTMDAEEARIRTRFGV